tara:strand:+ start:1976 stop:3049 length:1074 start_codon:yes stop_codon:yes gene_type:complete
VKKMTHIDVPNSPGYLISRWREKGPVELPKLTEWKEEMNIESWLMIAEAAMFLDAAELLAIVESELTPAEKATLGLVRRRMLGDQHLEQAINDAIEIAKNPESRDLKLEGRLRMERGLSRFESGDTEGAEEDLTWAEIRLKSVSKASRDHDLSLLNKAAFHMAVGAPLMALTVYSDISRTAGHADETIAISRIGASRIRASLGHTFDAARHAWNAHAHAIKAFQTNMAIEAGTLYIELSLDSIDENAERMKDQVSQAKPRSATDDEPNYSANINDIEDVFMWCHSKLPESNSGEQRPDLRAMVSIASKINKLELFENLLSNPDGVEDSMLVAIIQACVSDEELRKKWNQRLTVLTMI